MIGEQGPSIGMGGDGILDRGHRGHRGHKEHRVHSYPNKFRCTRNNLENLSKSLMSRVQTKVYKQTNL